MSNCEKRFEDQERTTSGDGRPGKKARPAPVAAKQAGHNHKAVRPDETTRALNEAFRKATDREQKKGGKK